MEVGGLLRRRPLRLELLQGVRGCAGDQAERQDSYEFAQQWGGTEGKSAQICHSHSMLSSKRDLTCADAQSTRLSEGWMWPWCQRLHMRLNIPVCKKEKIFSPDLSRRDESVCMDDRQKKKPLKTEQWRKVFLSVYYLFLSTLHLFLVSEKRKC